MKYKKGDYVRIKKVPELDMLFSDSSYPASNEFCSKFGGDIEPIQNVLKNGVVVINQKRVDSRCIELTQYCERDVKETPLLVDTPSNNWFIENKIAEVKEFLPPANEGPLDETLMKSALRFNEGKPKWTLVHFNSLVPLVRVLEYGAKKYAPYNWQKPMSRMDILDSMQRAMAKLIDGEENDEESGLPHIGHILANAMFYSFHVTNKK